MTSKEKYRVKAVTRRQVLEATVAGTALVAAPAAFAVFLVVKIGSKIVGVYPVTKLFSAPDKEAMYLKTNQYHIAQFAYLTRRMKEINEGETSLLDNSILMCTSSLFDGDAHTALGQRAGILPIDRTQKRLRRAHYGIAHAAILTTVGASPSWSAYLRHSDRYFMVPRNPTYPSGRTMTTFFLVPSKPMPSSSNCGL